MRVVSFTLWGSKPIYTVGAVRNAELLPLHYPGWRGRFYCGTSVPPHIVRALEDFEHVDVIHMPEPGDWRSLMWRFLPASDEDVQIMISRDTDSRLNAREAAAVKEWLASDKDFHTMRDHPSHGLPILAGMWGVRNRALKQMADLIRDDHSKNWNYMDQDFLTTSVLPLIQKTWFQHDEYFHGKRFPTPRVGKDHVGQVFDEFDHRWSHRPSNFSWRRRQLTELCNRTKYRISARLRGL